MNAKCWVIAALLVQPAAALAADRSGQDRVDVAYEEMANGQNRAAIQEIQASGLARKGDPSALINLGTAYARVGETGKALEAYQAAMASQERYDVQLSDGSWVDTREAARRAIRDLKKAGNLAMR